MQISSLNIKISMLIQTWDISKPKKKASYNNLHVSIIIIVIQLYLDE